MTRIIEESTLGENKRHGAGLRLSQCMIVKNEEKNIERALSWAKGIAFEQIVVDTGSTDRTIEIAERMGAKVFHFKWIDDFSAAKNYALGLASGDWIAFLDADEYMSAEHARLIIPLIEKSIALYGNRSAALNSKWAHIKDDGSIIQIERQQRIFINSPYVRYERPIHEELEFPAGAGPITENNILIIHTGYSQYAYADTGKRERNIALLKKALRSDPENIKSKCYLAEALYAFGRIKEALPLYRETLDKTGEGIDWARFRANAFYHLISAQMKNSKTGDEAFALAEQAFHEFPDYLNFCFLYGVALHEQERFKDALDVFKKAEKLVADGKIENQKIDNIAALYVYLARTCEKLDNSAEALRYAAFYLQSFNKRHYGMLKLCARMLRSNEGPENTVNFLSNIYDFTDAHDGELLLRCAKDTGDIALEQLIKGMNDEHN